MSRRRKRRHRPADAEDLVDGSSSSDVDVLNDLPTSPRQKLLSALVAWFPLLLLIQGNGRNPWVPALAALLVGLLLILNPPRNRVPYAFLLIVAGVALLPLLALLPMPEALMPEWRHTLIHEQDLKLSNQWSGQPWVTLENACSLMIVLLWLSWGVAHWQTSSDRMSVMRQLALGISVLAIVSLGLHFTGRQPATWGSGMSYDIGPYANRNHFACLMAMNAVLCLATAYDLQRRKKGLWVLYALGVVPSFAAVMVNTSLGGLLAFSAGIVTWLALATLRGKSLQKLAVAGSMLLVLTAGVVVYGQHLVGELFDDHSGIIDKLAQNSRLDIYRNTLGLVSQQPVLGVGLGNFGAVFCMTHQLGETYVRYRHPESDWLWFLAEAGWPAALLVLTGLVLFVRWMAFWQSSQGSTQRRERRLRLAAGLAVLVSLGHGLVDVPNHVLSHALLVALLAAMALHPKRLNASAGRVLVLPFRLAGAALIIASALWAAVGMGYPSPMGESVWRRDLELTKVLLKQGEVRAAAEAVESAINAAPLNWEGYYLRAETSLKLGRASSFALADFSRARAMEPKLANVCMAEARLWLRYDPMMAVPAWREALNREQSRDVGRYGEMLQATKLYPELRPAVRSLAQRASFLMSYLNTTQGEEFQQTLTELIHQFPKLEGMTAQQRLNLFRLWRERGDRAELVKALQANREWRNDGWTVLADELAAQGKHKEAYDLAQEFIVTAINLTSDPSVKLDQLEHDFSFFPSDPQRGLRLYVAQREAKQFDAAIVTLSKVAAQPKAPKHVNFELGRVHALKGDYIKAWEFTSLYIRS